MPTKLGQNFLNNPEIITQIINSANISADDFVLEIGPGEGILTKELVKYAAQVKSIELDSLLIPDLQEKFLKQANLEIITGDILKINLQEITQNKPYKVIANIPYYITSPIIRLFLESPCQPKEMILMIQKEVAQRIVASPGKMSILSNSVQYYAHAEILFLVSHENFTPTPKVDSAVIKIVPHTSFNSSNSQTKSFFRLIRAGFSSKRKTLLNNLLNSLHIEKGLLEAIFKQISLKPTVRAQELSISTWKALSKLLTTLS
jgi:16S rRNA (adenine1518-N6/adenine1519-N6)-dimethyltransferase